MIVRRKSYEVNYTHLRRESYLYRAGEIAKNDSIHMIALIPSLCRSGVRSYDYARAIANTSERDLLMVRCGEAY